MDDEMLFDYLMANNAHLRSYRPLRDNGEEEEGLVASVDLEKDAKKFGSVPTGAPEEGLAADNSHFHTIGKKKRHKWTDAEMEEIRALCETTIVHDFSENDFFHISDEDRAQMDALAEIRPQMSTVASIYRRVDNFIIGMRTVMKAIAILEKKYNVMYSTDNFYRMLAEGKIQPVGFIIPKLRAKNKYDPGVLAKYIEDESLDPDTLLTERERAAKNGISFADSQLSMETKEEYEDKTRRLFTPEELAQLDSVSTNPPELVVSEIDPKFITGYSATRSYFGQDQKPKFKNRGNRLYADAIHDMLNVIENTPGFNPDPNADVWSRTYSNSSNILLGGSFEPVEKEPNPVESVRYEGSLTDSDAFELFKIQLDNAYLDSMYGQQSYQTNQSVINKKLFDEMERAGINVIELRRAMNVPGAIGGITSDSDDYFMKKRALESNMRLEADICARIIGMNDDPKFLKIVNKAEEMASAEERGLVR